MQRPQHLGLAELRHVVQPAVADQATFAEEAPWSIAPLPPACGKAFDRVAYSFGGIGGRGRQPARDVGMEAHGGIGLGVVGHERAERQALGLQHGHLYTTLRRREESETGSLHISATGKPHPKERRQTWQLST